MDKARLIEQCCAGDREAMGQLYSLYSQRMMHVITHYVPDPDAAKDILHDGFLVIYGKIGQVKNPAKLEFWMGTIMKNLALQYLTEKDLTQLLSEDYDVQDVPEFDESLPMSELTRMVEELPIGYRKVFKLAVMEHRTHKEIAAMLGISEQTSGIQLFRARALLRKLISERKLQLGLGVAGILLAIGGLWMGLTRGDFPIADIQQPAFTKVVNLADTTVSATQTLAVVGSQNCANSIEVLDSHERTTARKEAIRPGGRGVEGAKTQPTVKNVAEQKSVAEQADTTDTYLRDFFGIDGNWRKISADELAQLDSQENHIVVVWGSNFGKTVMRFEDLNEDTYMVRFDSGQELTRPDGRGIVVPINEVECVYLAVN